MRVELARLYGGDPDVVVELTGPGGNDLEAGAGAGARAGTGRYQELMSRTTFALCPRGDALFSYRFSEALSFGAVPVVLADGWVLPFGDLIDWSGAVVVVPEASVDPVLTKLRIYLLICSYVLRIYIPEDGGQNT